MLYPCQILYYEETFRQIFILPLLDLELDKIKQHEKWSLSELILSLDFFPLSSSFRYLFTFYLKKLLLWAKPPISQIGM